MTDHVQTCLPQPILVRFLKGPGVYFEYKALVLAEEKKRFQVRWLEKSPLGRVGDVTHVWKSKVRFL